MAEKKTGRYAQVVSKGGPIEVVTREVDEPAAGQVRVRVQACGVCHSDAITKYGIFPISYPRSPGHEVVGLVDAIGDGVLTHCQLHRHRSVQEDVSELLIRFIHG